MVFNSHGLFLHVVGLGFQANTVGDYVCLVAMCCHGIEERRFFSKISASFSCSAFVIVPSVMNTVKVEKQNIAIVGIDTFGVRECPKSESKSV